MTAAGHEATISDTKIMFCGKNKGLWNALDPNGR